MRSLVQRIRRKLWLVSYYSANRPRSKWTRVQNAGLVIALAIAVPGALVAETLVSRVVTREVVRGRMSGVRGQWITAQVIDPDFNGPWGEAPPVGEWSLLQDVSERGWPVASRTERGPPRLEINDFNQVGVRADVDLPEDDLARLAIEAALVEAGSRHRLPPAGQRGETVSARRWFGFTRNAIVVWVTSSIVVIVLAFVARHLERLRHIKLADRVAVREASGRCHRCGYDLRGLEFSARCPECGSLQQ